MKPKVFIDGKEGTTGLQIYDRLANRTDIELLLIDEAKRKDTEERRRLINEADLVFLCLPDKAAIEAVSLIENPNTRVIDASTAHRTNPDWDYGFPELSPEHREAIVKSKRVANPGCHASGFVSIVYPLIKAGVLPKDYALTCFSLTGYSGGGKKMIAEYESEDKANELNAPRIYGLSLNHKHIPEMTAVTGLEKKPIFCPIVDDYYCGMATSVPIQGIDSQLILDALKKHYEGQQFVKVMPELCDTGMLEANYNVGTNMMEITVCGNGNETLVVSRFDNLGKGASGSAVENMNLMLGFEPDSGL
ncbi:MAG: N-acetyl-gamma-glutamyl-phosphate reductase [Ruminococcaceae bacterium]|nr:N-acetyl-gamma-glutamyl-phosphate reductase [Oscillospiraceae bacterium]